MERFKFSLYSIDTLVLHVTNCLGDMVENDQDSAFVDDNV